MKLKRSSNLLHKAFLAINITYIFVLLFVDLLLPPNGLLSISNILLPFVLIGQSIVFFRHKYFRIIGIIISVWCFYSLTNNYIHPPLTFQECTEIFRLVKILAISFSVLYVYKYYPNIVPRLLVVSFLLQVAIVAFQLLKIDWFIDVYVPRLEQVIILKHGLIDARVSGIFSNPNDLGFFNLLCALYFFFSNSRSRYFLLTLALLVVFMSQSRTVFIALLFIIGVLSTYYYFKNKKIKFNPKPMLLVVALVFIFCLFLPNTRSLLDGSAFKSHSFLARFEIIGNTIEVNKTSVFFGQGYVADIPKIVGGAIDNEYAFVYLQSGLIGLLLLATTVILGLILVRKFPSRLFFYISFAVFFIVGFTNLSFSNFGIIPYFAIMSGLIVGKYHTLPQVKQ